MNVRRVVNLTVTVLLAVVLLCGGGGCASIRITDPARTATEQYLLSEAAMHAIDGLDVSLLHGRHVFVDTAFLNSGSLSAEQSFAVAELRARVLQAGARVVPAKDKADVVVEVRSEALGIDRWDNLLGIPAFAVPGAVSSTGAVPIITPELALLKTNKQHGYASFSFVAYWADTGELLTSSGPAMGETLREDFWILGVGPRKSGNIPTADYPKEPEPKP